MEWNQLVWFVPPAIVALLIGHAVGMRKARKVGKQSRQKLDEQSLELLDTRAALTQAKMVPVEYARKDRLLQLVLSKLQMANKDIKVLQQQREKQTKKHFVEVSHLRARAAEASVTARKACEIAVNTTMRLDNLSQQAGSAGQDETLPISLAERARMYGANEPVVSVHKALIVDHTPELQNDKKANMG